MKCVDMTRDEAWRSVASFVVAAAILVMDIEDVFVARMACLGAICANWEKMEVFKSGISGTASMTKSTSERSERLVLGTRRLRTRSAVSRVMRSLETSFSSSLSGKINLLAPIDNYN